MLVFLPSNSSSVKQLTEFASLSSDFENQKFHP